MLQVVPENGHQ